MSRASTPRQGTGGQIHTPILIFLPGEAAFSIPQPSPLETPVPSHPSPSPPPRCLHHAEPQGANSTSRGPGMRPPHCRLLVWSPAELREAASSQSIIELLRQAENCSQVNR